MLSTLDRWVKAGAAVAIIGLAGCGNRQQPVTMAPPVSGGGGMGMQSSPTAGSAGVYNWQDVPRGQQVPVSHAAFDQGGYQIYAQTGETIVVPFANQNLYVMKFGRSNTGQLYFVNEGDVPVLYVPQGGYLTNAAANDARWYPIPDDFSYSRPIYVSLAPTWADYMAMGWYPGMHYYGGMWGYSPGVHFVWMPSFYIGLGGHRYTSYTSYRSYYVSHPGFVRTTTAFNYSAPRSTGSFGRSAVSSTGSFGRRSMAGSSSFGGSSTSSGSFGSRRSGSSFGSSSSSAGGSFGSSSRPSFGSGSSFGSGKSSFGGGSSSFGSGRSRGGSFGSGRSSFGGSFGRRRR